jgi:OOP family OmpA-OmpF porin
MHIKNCTKLFLLTTLLSVALSSTFAQKSAIGFHVTGTEYDGDLNSNRHKYYQFKFLQPGGGISLQQYLNPSFNMVEMASYDRVQYQNDTKTQGVDAQFFTLNIKFKYKFNNGYIFKEGAAISPFIIAGLGATYIMSKQFAIAQSAKITDGAVKANIVAGAGIYFRFNDAVGLELANTINMPLFDEWDGVTNSSNDLYLQHSVGLIFALSKPKDTDKDGVPDKKDKCANTPKGVKVDATGCPIDADGDGVPDYLDKCPTLKGIEVLNGCPDTDGDGVADEVDKCPNTPQGATVDATGCTLDTDGDDVPDYVDKCPNTTQGATVDATGCTLDADGDGVADYVDKCPNTPKGATVDATGCILDTDGDGVADYVDKCPNTPKGAQVDVNGCQVVKEAVKKRLQFATRGIYFETGKSILKKSSSPMLNEVVSIINEYPDYNLRMGGHTDAVGSDAKNLILSQDRVDAVKAYLVNNGISENRIEATGFGAIRPIATNKTAQGRAKNRRVELELFLK